MGRKGRSGALGGRDGAKLGSIHACVGTEEEEVGEAEPLSADAMIVQNGFIENEEDR